MATLQYMGNWNTDGCTSAGCAQTLAASSSLTQGQTFANLTKTLHGGRRSRKNNRRNRKMKNRKNTRRQRGGMADYPGGFSETLPQNLHQLAWVNGQDAAFAQLPQFVGKYGMSGGSRRRNRRVGGALHPALVTAPSMILTPQEEPAAMLNPQWYTENQVVPSFQGPNNAYAAQATAAYAHQADYKQHAGRRSRKNRKNRKASRRNRNRKGSRKN